MNNTTTTTHGLRSRFWPFDLRRSCSWRLLLDTSPLVLDASKLSSWLSIFQANTNNRQRPSRLNKRRAYTLLGLLWLDETEICLAFLHRLPVFIHFNGHDAIVKRWNKSPKSVSWNKSSVYDKLIPKSAHELIFGLQVFLEVSKSQTCLGHVAYLMVRLGHIHHVTSLCK